MTKNERLAQWAERQADAQTAQWAVIQAKPWDRRHADQQRFLLAEADRFTRMAAAYRARDRKAA